MRVTSTKDSGTENRQVVAAVCFRILSTDIEFLLVRTRRGRWTFPKGGAEPGFTHAQSAAIEAYEEAGVHGRIEEISFTKYKLRRTDSTFERRSHDLVHAHLCEVLRHDSPLEPHRDPTWFSSERAKGRLAQGRSGENAAELARVVDRAVSRIRRQPARTLIANDPLMKIRFEASEISNTGVSDRTRHNFVRLQRKRTSGKVLELPIDFVQIERGSTDS